MPLGSLGAMCWAETASGHTPSTLACHNANVQMIPCDARHAHLGSDLEIEQLHTQSNGDDKPDCLEVMTNLIVGDDKPDCR